MGQRRKPSERERLPGAQPPVGLGSLRLRLTRARPEGVVAGVLYRAGHWPERVVEFEVTGPGIRVWMAWPWAETLLADLEAQATAAGCGSVVPLGVYIERLRQTAGRPRPARGHGGNGS